jgi:hypothetical protein
MPRDTCSDHCPMLVAVAGKEVSLKAIEKPFGQREAPRAP